MSGIQTAETIRIISEIEKYIDSFKLFDNEFVPLVNFLDGKLKVAIQKPHIIRAIEFNCLPKIKAQIKTEKLTNEIVNVLEGWVNEKKALMIQSIPKEIDTSNDLPEIDLSTQREQIRLLYELGVIDFLQSKFPASLKDNNNQTAHLISQFLKLNRVSVQPTLNALLNDNSGDRNYPKKTKNVIAIIDQLNSNELS